MNVQQVNKIIDDYGAERTCSLAILQDVQRKFNYLPREALHLVAERLDVPVGEIYHMATFYRSFTLKPKGEHCVGVCLGTACHVHGAPRVLDALERELGIHAGESTADGQFSLEATACLGACAQAPVVRVNDELHSQVTSDRVSELVEMCTCAVPETE
jgi:NADH-quinone oxidoreductase subunit E